MLKKTNFLLLSLMPILAFASITNKYQAESSPTVPMQKFAITKQPIILNTQVDDIQQLDPRIKSVIMYAHIESTPVHIYYFSNDNKRYASKVLELFKSSQVNSVSMSMGLTNNLMDKNLIKIYLEESKNVSTIND